MLWQDETEEPAPPKSGSGNTYVPGVRHDRFANPSKVTKEHNEYMKTRNEAYVDNLSDDENASAESDSSVSDSMLSRSTSGSDSPEINGDSDNELAVETMAELELLTHMQFKNTRREFPKADTYLPSCIAETTRYLLACRKTNIKKLVLDEIDVFVTNKTNRKLDEGFASLDYYLDVQNDIDRASGEPRTFQQRKITQLVRRAIAPKVFGKDFSQYATSVMKRENWDRISTNVAVSMTRRSGKTVGVARNVVSCLFAIRGVRIAVFSPSARQSEMLGDAIEEALSYVQGWKVQSSKEHITLANPNDDNDNRYIDLYPCVEAIRVSDIVFFSYNHPPPPDFRPA